MTDIPADASLLGVMTTLVAWTLAETFARAFPVTRRFVPPILVAVALVALFLTCTHLPYAQYAKASEPISFLLGPAVVALALPIHRHRREVAASLPGLLAASITGICAAVAASFVIAVTLRADPNMLVALLTTQATSPVATAVAGSLGGPASLAAVLAIISGILGAVAGPALFRAFRITDPRVRGLALGISSHAIGTSRAFDMDAETGTYAAIGMAFGAVLVPVIITLVAAIPWLATFLP
ncbi:Putative effector of murein hydrolase [Micromonospora pallida]|uniref:Putative effector of murein hydrolase n=1 Tax=Micromonospora pallida TaxID=145854 RepID=A0A1C6SIP5_9ACTN|nr:LrgB family protein [Micromonospora pallida]SCL29278.1 Putative effector of murein hydrolase [Micromonospora pallida]